MKTPSRARSSGASAEQILAVVGHRAAGNFVFRMAGDRAGEGALAGPVRAHDGVDFALLDREVDAAQDFLAAAADLKILDL